MRDGEFVECDVASAMDAIGALGPPVNERRKKPEWRLAFLHPLWLLCSKIADFGGVASWHRGKGSSSRSMMMQEATLPCPWHCQTLLWLCSKLWLYTSTYVLDGIQRGTFFFLGTVDGFPTLCHIISTCWNLSVSNSVFYVNVGLLLEQPKTNWWHVELVSSFFGSQTFVSYSSKMKSGWEQG